MIGSREEWQAHDHQKPEKTVGSPLEKISNGPFVVPLYSIGPMRGRCWPDRPWTRGGHAFCFTIILSSGRGLEDRVLE